MFRRWRVPAGILWLGAFCTILPDFDVAGMALGIQRGETFSHRGITHSLAFAAATGLLLTALLRPKGSKAACALYLFLCTASHGLLDSMTSGGQGIAFFAPFDNGRYFLPWRPILVSPIGVKRFLSERGLRVLASELVWIWIPAFALRFITTYRFRRSSTSRARRQTGRNRP